MTTADAAWAAQRRSIIRDSAGIGVAVGAYAVGFGALSVASGLSVAQTVALSALMFTGASQFALVGVIGAGGSGVAAALAALMLGLRNALYGLRMAPVLGVSGPRMLLAAQLTIDESTAMAVAREDDPDPRAQRVAFWATGISIYVCWNAMTLVGALGADALGDPTVYGLDAVVPAAFLALLWPRLRGRWPWLVAVASAGVALALTPALPPGVPVLAAALVAVVVGLRSGLALAPVRPEARPPDHDEGGAR